MASAVSIGVDIGQRVDPTAIVVAEAVRPYSGTRPEFIIRDLGRLPLGTPYPAVAQQIAWVVARLAERRPSYRRRGQLIEPEPPHIRMDATGLGQPVVELVRQMLDEQDLDYALTPVTFTHGDRYSRRWVEGAVSVGKAYLVSRLQMLLQTERIQLPQTPEARALAQELLDYEIRVSEDANDRYGAFRVGSHDDLVTALGLAVLEDPWDADDYTISMTINGVPVAPF